MPPLVVLGLGNPGSAYVDTRHNAGYRVVDIVLEHCLPGPDGLCLKKPFFSFTRFFSAVYHPASAGQASAEPVSAEQRPMVFLRYDGYMNNSGSGLPAVLRKFGAGPADLLVVVDNMDLPPGACRLRQGGGTAGHNGLKSVEACLGSGRYSRLYIGVGRPKQGETVVDYVLGIPEDEDARRIEQACRRGAEGVVELSRRAFNRVAEELNRREY